MPFYEFAFRYDPSHGAVESACEPGPSTASVMVARAEAEEKLRQEFYRSTGVKREPSSWASIELSANNDELIRTLHRRAQDAAHTHAGSIASAVVYDKLTPSEQAQAEWFLVLPKELPFHNAATDNFSSEHEDGYPTCHAFQVPPGIHILERHHVSEKFRDVVIDNGLSGLDFLWARDKGKYRPRIQWYCAVATKPLGHGLDHPFYDRARTDAEWPSQNDPTYQQGAQDVSAKYMLRDGWALDEAHWDDLVNLVPKETLGLRFSSSYLRFLRSHVPKADFAYRWDVHGDNWGGFLRHRYLCVTRRAKELLEENALLAGAHLTPIVLFDRPPAPTVDLDNGAAFPPPALTNDELAALRTRESELLAAYDPARLPVRKPDLKSALAALRAEKRSRPADFGKGLSKKKVAALEDQLGVRLTDPWRKVLTVSASGTFRVDEPDCEMVAPTQLPEFHQSTHAHFLQNDPSFPTHVLCFGHSSTGDTYALETTDKQVSADSTVIMIDHETGDVTRRWESVADFLDWVINDPGP